jgi:hypothetical protein
MNELDKNKKLAEILKLARLSLNDEFMNKYAESHQAWQVACNQAWITKGMLLPYSNKFVYPTEQEIVAKAVEIYNTLTPTEQAGLVANVPTPIEDDAVLSNQVDETVNEVTEAPEELLVEAEPTQPTVEEPITIDVPFSEASILEEAIEEEKPQPQPELESKFKSLFTKWGGKGSY